MGNCWGTTPVTTHNCPSPTKPSAPETTGNRGKGNRPGSRSSSQRKQKEDDKTTRTRMGKDETAMAPPSDQQIRAVSAPKVFTLAELKSATRNFKPHTVLGEGGFGRVFKGWVDEKTYAPAKVGVGMAVAVKKSNPESSQGLEEWQSEAYNAKLSDFGLAKLGPLNGDSHVTTKIVGTYGYAAPEYLATGHLYVKSDVYGFGVVLLELLTGLKALDTNRPSRQHNLVEFAKPCLSDKRKLKKIMDPRIAEQYPLEAAMEAAELILRCLESDLKNRPSMEEVSETLIKIKDMKEKPRKSRSSCSNGSYAKRQEESFRHQSPLQYRHAGTGYNGSSNLPGVYRFM
ncbi:SERINE/THREONINE-PROTEIN KINASE CX32 CHLOROPLASTIC-RELATED [Salix viminalis]|uniref:SERINE/THREONINE-PROTEIN KINASE CX32 CHLOROPLASTIC-RELATED n=1 Tax=Salix viminalis TaxID=40686 RepID=A0A9Q0ZEA7_SALVM|nr:SERINE/THREONINE-PROTEIN KINASE CX32 CHLOROPLASTIC-RELATED [Salix viminalis]